MILGPALPYVVLALLGIGTATVILLVVGAARASNPGHASLRSAGAPPVPTLRDSLEDARIQEERREGAGHPERSESADTDRSPLRLSGDRSPNTAHTSGKGACRPEDGGAGGSRKDSRNDALDARSLAPKGAAGPFSVFLDASAGRRQPPFRPREAAALECHASVLPSREERHSTKGAAVPLTGFAVGRRVGGRGARFFPPEPPEAA